MSKRVGVLLSGCGHRDGSEIHETTCALLALDRAGVEIIGIAPNYNQSQVTNHLNGSDVGESRNMMHEAARIMRGNVRPVLEVSADDFDALILPGGFGAALNLCSYGKVGRDCEVDSDVKTLVLRIVKSGKPLGAICIAPVLVAKILENSGINATLTIGNDKNVANDINSFGATHKDCVVTDAVVDSINKIVSTPAYMLAKRISEVEAGVTKLVNEVVGML